MPDPGYYRFPAIHADTVVFTSEDDLWSVPAGGGIARRLTASPGVLSRPFFSPDGATLAFTGREEGHTEVYTMPADGGVVHRVTYLGVGTNTIGWTPDGEFILLSSDSGRAFGRSGAIVWRVSPGGGLPEDMKLGEAVSIALRADGRTVLGRNNNDPATWKRYRGGTAGQLWIDATGSGRFEPLIRLRGNLARPMWVGDRIFFVSDHEGYGNIYSCLQDGADLRRHTHHEDYYVRHPNCDGSRIVYHAGADLFVLDPCAGESRRVDVAYHSPRTQRQRRFVDPARYLESYAPHPQGHSLAMTARGRSATMGNWEGAVLLQGGDPITPREPVRYRLTRWLNDGKRVVTVTDRGGQESLEIHYPGEDRQADAFDGLDIGRPYSLRVSPTADHLVLNNHRNELIFVDLEAKSLQVIDRNQFGSIQGMDWSPDGRWVAYACGFTQYTMGVRIWDRTTGETFPATEPVLNDFQPIFDPEGKYLYFLGSRELNPVYDSLHFDLGFPRSVRPYLVTLQSDVRSPFSPVARPLQPQPEKKSGSEGDDAKSSDTTGAGGEAVGPEAETKPPSPVRIDGEGITQRVVAFPLPLGDYWQLGALKNKLLYTTTPVEGAIQEPRPNDAGRSTLEMYDLETLKSESLVSGMTDFQIASDGKTMYYRAGNKLRVVAAGANPDEKLAAEPPGRRSGWVDLGRVRLPVDPAIEWRQMAHEAWRLQREYFWTANLSEVDWDGVWTRYEPLIARLGTRGEFSDLLWEMQGELGTSHAYEMGGDYRSEPTYPQGFLGADFTWDDTGGYRITHIVRGAPGELKASSPLHAPGCGVRVGDRLIGINGRRLTRAVLPQELLLHQADVEVTLTVATDGDTRDVTVRTLRSELPARYREWVETNRRKVHEATGGKVGYVHIPDMGAGGYAEFHRLYLAEVAYDGLVVDARYNRGGHVSQLLLEKLGRKRVGYDVSRWQQPSPYPEHSVAGPMVALCNQFAGSDGDIFSHVFKLMKLGPLIGVRTWGGVIGISPRNPLADGAVTTQPEYSFWFNDVAWGVENYGTDPDIEVEITPQDYAQGVDPQLDKAIEVVLQRLESQPINRPLFDGRPSLRPSPLPPMTSGS